jgi:hypothetical protein
MSRIARKEVAMARPEMKENVAPANGAGHAEQTIDQVRELLFGEKERSNEQQHRAIEAAIEALRRDMLERFAMMESRMAEMDREVERRHAHAIDAIGVALTDLGAHVRKLAEPSGRK